EPECSSFHEVRLRRLREKHPEEMPPSTFLAILVTNTTRADTIKQTRRFATRCGRRDAARSESRCLYCAGALAREPPSNTSHSSESGRDEDRGNDGTERQSKRVVASGPSATTRCRHPSTARAKPPTSMPSRRRPASFARPSPSKASAPDTLPLARCWKPTAIWIRPC